MTALPKLSARTITVEVDGEEAARFEQAAQERGISVSELIVGMADWELSHQEWAAARESYTPEQVAQIEAALAEAERGEFIPHEEVFARLKERFPDQTGREIIEEALKSYAEFSTYAVDLLVLEEDAERLVADGIADMERGDETDQAEVFAGWRAKYG